MLYFQYHQLGTTLWSDNEKTTKMLGRQPRSREEAVLASAKCILELAEKFNAHKNATVCL